MVLFSISPRDSEIWEREWSAVGMTEERPPRKSLITEVVGVNVEATSPNSVTVSSLSLTCSVVSMVDLTTLFILRIWESSFESDFA